MEHGSIYSGRDYGLGSDVMSQGTSDEVPRLVIAVDYGTTYTGVAWTLTNGRDTPKLDDVKTVMVWPSGVTEAKVPSTYTYSSTPGPRWGHKISSKALVIRWTKLELEPPSLEKALENLKQTVSEAKQLSFQTGPNVRHRQVPHHLYHSSEDIVTAYLTEIIAVTRRDIQANKDSGSFTFSDTPIDLVITHPAIWDTRAKNITFRAVTNAFKKVFSDIECKLDHIRLATEPEACAQFLMRENLESGKPSLPKGSCFVVVDAGGGTVDLASYQVEQVFPSLRVKKITDVSGGNYGATLIDDFFIQTVLPSRLRGDDYTKLMRIGDAKNEHNQGTHIVLREGEQIMLEKFQTIKHNFKGRSETDEEPVHQYLTLPNGIGREDRPEDNVIGGQLILTCNDMMEMFEAPVNGTVELIQKQIAQIGLKGYQASAILLSGGFSRSEYLQQCINEQARSSHTQLLRGTDSWTAVAKGAVLMGLGIGCEVPDNNVECPFHIGIVLSSQFKPYEHVARQRYTDTFSGTDRARNHVHWVVAKNDLITPHEGIRKSVKLIRSFSNDGSKLGVVTIITAQDVGQKNINFWNRESRDNDPHDIHELKYDLSHTSTSLMRASRWKKDK